MKGIAVNEMPNPTDAEAAEALAEVNEAAWECMNKVKTELITEVSKNTVPATRTLGRD